MNSAIEDWKQVIIRRTSNLAYARECVDTESFFKELIRSSTEIEKRICQLKNTPSENSNNLIDEYAVILESSYSKMDKYIQRIDEILLESNRIFDKIDFFIHNADVSPEITHKKLDGEVIKLPMCKYSYETYFKALEEQIAEKYIINNCEEHCFKSINVDRGMYSICKNTSKEYDIVTMNGDGDIMVISKKAYKYPNQARTALEKYIQKLKQSGKLAHPIFMKQDHFIVLSALAKLGEEQTFNRFKQAVSSETALQTITNSEKSEKAFKILKEGVQVFFESGVYKKYLETMSYFNNYSFKNTLMIIQQKPHARLCAGITTWKKLGRYIKAGEEGITIFAPNLRNLSEDEKTELNLPLDSHERMLTGFRLAKVFDISQTEGKPLPRICENLSGTIDQFDKIIKALENISGIKIIFKEINGEAKGYFRHSSLGDEIVIRKGMDQLQSLKTAIHETAHSIFDNVESPLFISGSTKLDKEVRAESVAFMVSNRLGLDTSEYSFAYITSWSSSKDTVELEKNMNHIFKGVNMIVEGINKEIKLFETNDDFKNIEINLNSTNDSKISQSNTLLLS